MAQPLLLERDVLVQAPPGARLTVSTEGAEVVVSGGAQISRDRCSWCRPTRARSSCGRPTGRPPCPPCAQASIAAGGAVPDRPTPLAYDADDTWDRRFLSDAIELGNELEARSKGFSAQIDPADGRTVEFLLRLLPGLAAQPEFSPALFDAGRAPGESLVGAAIALEGNRGTFAERWAGVFGFRGEGAQWGLVALDQGVSRAPLLAAVDAAIGRGRSLETDPFPETPAGGADGGIALPTVPGTGAGGSGGSSGAGGSGGSGGSASPTTRPVAPTVPPPSTPNPNAGPLNTGIPLLDATINALVETLTGLLRTLGES